MRFMVFVMATAESEAGVMPSTELISAMGKFNEEMIQAGIMVDGGGLRPSKEAKRIAFSGSKRTVIDGPFPETKELAAGYWILECKSLEEVVEWMKRCPNPHSDGGELEIRPFYDTEDFENAPKQVIEQEKKFRSRKK